MKNIIIVAAIAALAGSAFAIDFNESGDAGLLPGTEQVASGSGVLNAINGSLLPDGDLDVDMYRIYISDPANFSASTSNLDTLLTDTTLYLFHLDGRGIAKNDDASNSNFLSTITSELVASLPAGEYLIAVSIFGTLPFDTVTPSTLDDSIFDANQFTGQTPARDNDVVVSWVDASAFVEGGAYRIEFTGASAIPAPSTAGLLLAGGLLASRRRRA